MSNVVERMMQMDRTRRVFRRDQPQNVPVTSPRPSKSVSPNFYWGAALTGRTDRLPLEYPSMVEFFHSASLVVQDNTKQDDEVEQSGYPTLPTLPAPAPANPILQYPLLPTSSGPTPVLPPIENAH